MGAQFLSTSKSVEEPHDPRQIFIDWVNNVRQNALNANSQLKYSRGKKNKDIYIDDASDYIGKIIGSCDAIMTVIKQ